MVGLGRLYKYRGKDPSMGDDEEFGSDFQGVLPLLYGHIAPVMKVFYPRCMHWG
jgi:hypothetical protein